MPVPGPMSGDSPLDTAKTVIQIVTMLASGIGVIGGAWLGTRKLASDHLRQQAETAEKLAELTQQESGFVRARVEALEKDLAALRDENKAYRQLNLALQQE